jgi:hypothetical protein
MLAVSARLDDLLRQHTDNGVMNEPKHASEPEPKPPLLPRWFATKGPRPGWLAEYWSMILAVLSVVVVFVNTVVAGQIESLTTKEWVNAAVAWITAVALFLQSRYKNVGAIARWRAQVRAEEATKEDGSDDPSETP